MRNIDEIYFCPHTLGFFSNFTEHDKNFFAPLIFLKLFTLELTGLCFLGQDLIVNKHNLLVSCFETYFPEKELN